MANGGGDKRQRGAGKAITWPPREATRAIDGTSGASVWQSLGDTLRGWIRAETGPGRLLPWVPVAFGAGIALYFTADHEPFVTVVVPSALALCVVALLARRWHLFPLIVMLVVGAVGYALVPRRDFGDGLLPDRPGPATAARSFSNPFALAWRLQRGVLLTWVISYALFGAVLGSIVKMFVDVVRDNPEVSTIMARMGGQGAYTDLMVSAMMSLFGLVASAYAVQATQRLRTEESSRRVEPLLATGTSRIGWALSHVLFTVLGTAALMVAFGLCFGLVDGAREGTLGHTVGADLMAALVQLPAAWVLGALAVTLFGLWPRLTGLGWAAVAIAVVLTDLGTELRLPQLVMDISPYTHLPKLPGGTVTSTPLLWLLAVTVLLLVVGLIGFRRRDIDTP